jgi:hypothetical protein
MSYTDDNRLSSSKSIVSYGRDMMYRPAIAALAVTIFVLLLWNTGSAG